MLGETSNAFLDQGGIACFCTQALKQQLNDKEEKNPFKNNGLRETSWKFINQRS